MMKFSIHGGKICQEDMIISHLLIAKLSLSFIRHVVLQYRFWLELSQIPRLIDNSGEIGDKQN